MNSWLQFVAALLFIIVCVAAAIPLINDDVAAAQHEALLDELWHDEAIA